jgi:hypothetical protein
MKVGILGFLGIYFIILPNIINAQTVLYVPSNTHNTRFYSDRFNIDRPALSIAGFDNNGDNSRGYGLRQILEKLYNRTADSLMVQNYNQIVELSKKNLTDPFNPPNGHYTTKPITIVNDNSNILQYRAFVALARYVLYKNDITDQIPDSTQIAPAYDVAISNLHSAFLKPEYWLLANSNTESDQGKWTRSMDNYARALNLYLALEN